MKISIMNVGDVMQKRRTDQTQGLLKRSKTSPRAGIGAGTKKAMSNVVGKD